MIIYVCGLQRTGKTTFAKKLKNKLKNSNVISCEALRNAFQKIDNEHYVEWGTKTSEQRQDVFPKFVKEFLLWNENFSSNITILDCALIDPPKVKDMLEKNDFMIVFGFGGKNNEEIFSCIKSFENSKDYTTNISKEKLLKIWGDLSLRDQQNIEFCKENNIKYFNAFSNRNKVQSVAIKYVLKMIKSNK